MKFLTCLQDADGAYSWGRCAGVLTATSAVFAFLYVVLKTHAIPDPMTLAGLSAWATSPYLATKGISAFARPANADKL